MHPNTTLLLPSFRSPGLKLLVLSNMDPNHILRHLRVPRGALLELSCDTNLPFPNHNLENLSRLQDWRYTQRETAGVKEKTLTGMGSSGSIRVKWIQHIPWVDFFSPFSLSCLRKLHLHNVDTHFRTSDALETMLGGMDHLETVILDGSNFKFFCSALARRGPTPLCPSLHTLVYCETWSNFVCHFVESVAKCRYQTPNYRDQHLPTNN